MMPAELIKQVDEEISRGIAYWGNVDKDLLIALFAIPRVPRR